VLGANGVNTARDEWVYDVDAKALAKKAKFLGEEYNRLLKERDASFPVSIKWSRDLKRKFEQGRKSKFDRKGIISALYRPFTELSFYTEKLFVDVLTDNHYRFFGENLDKDNIVICFLRGGREPFSAFVSRHLIDFHFYVSDTTFCLALYCYDEDGHRQDNLTDWGLRQFQKHYGDAAITKRDIFHYTYAVLHHPDYRTKYEINLKREFPRLPFYADFRQWAKWGQSLMELHLNYEQAAPFPLERRDIAAGRAELPLRQGAAGSRPAAQQRRPTTQQADEKPALKPKLKAVKETGSIEIDATTTLTGIPAEAWDYKLGNRSGLEWVLDQWKEHKISDPTVAEKFNTYRFADHKEKVIELLQRVCTVSVETMKVVNGLPALQERKN
jgi:predicted helicase